jgi:multidrug resistance efflux pump
MIVFLTLCYCAVVFLLVKIRVLKPTRLVMLSPIAWLLLLFVGLFVPMMFWAPSGNIIITKRVTQMTPRVSGRIIKIHAEPNVMIKAGAPLFTVDPQPYQDKVNALKAQLAAAKQNVLELKASLEASTAAVGQAKAQRDALKAALDAAADAVTQAKAQRELAATSNAINIADNQQAPGAVSKLQLQKSAQGLIQAEAGVKLALANEQNARVQYESVSTANILAAIANETKARVAYTSEINGVNTTVAQVTAQLAEAEYNLSQTTVYAPTDGFVTDLMITEGSAVSILAANAMLNFVSEDQPAMIIAAIEEKNLRYVKPGQAAEVVLPLYPGQTMSGKVVQVIWATGEGQVLAQGGIPKVAARVQTGGKFAVHIQLDPEWSEYQQPIGAGGIAAVYTDRGQPTHIIRKVMLRMTAWTNYVFQMPGQ